MSHSIVIQSHRNPLPHDWLKPCLDSVQHWADLNGFEYRFLDGNLFQDMDESLMKKTKDQIVIATDLARLLWLRRLLEEGYEQVFWCDADFLVFHPERFHPIDASTAVGREVWVQNNDSGRLKVYRKVHNAFLMFSREDSLLDFYIDTATRLLHLNSGSMPPQFIGPKLLTALHNIARFPVQENAAMLSPLVIQDIIKGGGAALSLLFDKSDTLPDAANLCASSIHDGVLSDQQMLQAVKCLLDDGPTRPATATKD